MGRALIAKKEGLMRRGLFPKVALITYLLLLMLPIYWLINLSLRSNEDIMSHMALWPHHPTLEKYFFILSDPTWVHAFGVSLTYVAINTVISVTVALPAAYAFNRYTFIGDKHLFFWLLTNLMAPASVYAMPFFNLYYAVGLFDTVWAVALAHCLFNVPLAVWILEGFIGGVPPRDRRSGGDRRLFLSALLRPDIPAADRQRDRRDGVLLLHVFLGRAAARHHAHGNQCPALRCRDDSQLFGVGNGLDLARSRRRLDHDPRCCRHLFVRNHIAKGFALGRV